MNSIDQIKAATKPVLVTLVKQDPRFNRKMNKQQLLDLALLKLAENQAATENNEAAANATPTTPAPEKDANAPSDLNVPKGHLFCGVCKTHQPTKSMDKMSQPNTGICKDDTACNNRAKAAKLAKAKAATNGSKARTARKANGDYSAHPVAKVHVYRDGTKMATMVDKLRTEEGATLAALADLIDTSEINVRHRVTYMMPRKGYNVVCEKGVYRITGTYQVEEEAANA